MRTFELFSAKNFGFFEIYDVSSCPHGQEGKSQCGHIADKGEGVNFS